MRKYLGSERAGISAKGDIKIKEEVFESVNEEALYARTNFYRPIGGRGNVKEVLEVERVSRELEVQQEEYK